MIKISKLEFYWIRFWYNDITRIIGVMLGGFTALIFIVLYFINPILINRPFVISVYIAFVCLAFIDNDYSNLRKTGLDEHRNKLK